MKINLCNALVTVIFTLQSYVWTLELSLAQKAAIQSKFLTSGLHCMRSNPLSWSDINSLKNKNLPNKKSAKCFMKCLFMELGIMDDMGKMSAAKSKENAMEVFSDDKTHLSNVEKIIQTCSASVNTLDINIEGQKDCDVAVPAFKCLVANAPKYGFAMDF